MDMITHLDKFSVLRDVFKPGSMAISDPNFSKWVKNRHDVFGRWKTLFPTLVFLIRKYFSAPQRFLSTNRVWYLRKHFISNTHLRPGILTIVNEGAEKEKVSSKRCEGSSRFHVPCTNQDFHFSEFTDKRVFPETSNILADTKLEKSRSSLFEIAPQFPKPPRTDQDERVRMIHSKIGRASGRRSEIGTEGRKTPRQFPKQSRTRLFINEAWQGRSTTEVHRVFRVLMSNSYVALRSLGSFETRFRAVSQSLPRTDMDETHMSGKGVSQAAGHKQIPHIKGAAQRHVSDSHAPTLYYHSSTDVALDGLKESVADIKKKLAEGGGFIEKSGSDNPHISDRISDTMDNGNINLTHLTDQVYQMLERKIMVEKERKCW